MNTTMKMTWGWGLALVAMTMASSALAQSDMAAAKIISVHVAGNVHLVTGEGDQGWGGNIGASVGDDGILLIDDKFEPLADKIRAALAGIGDGKLAFILNTHWHGDHTGGNVSFGREAPIIAHTNVRRRLAKDSTISGRTRDEPMAPPGLPVITFDASLSIHFNGEEVRARHYPHAHTDGDTVLHFTHSNVIHMGDIMFAERFPFVDTASGGSVAGVLKAVDAVIAMAPPGVKIIPGHGAVTDVDGLKRYRAMLAETSATVAKAVAAGKSLEEIQGAGLGERWKGWGSGYISAERWITTLHAAASER